MHELPPQPPTHANYNCEAGSNKDHAGDHHVGWGTGCSYCGEDSTDTRAHQCTPRKFVALVGERTPCSASRSAAKDPDQIDGTQDAPPNQYRGHLILVLNGDMRRWKFVDEAATLSTLRLSSVARRAGLGRDALPRVAEGRPRTVTP